MKLLSLIFGIVGFAFKILFAVLGFCASCVIAMGAAEELENESGYLE